MPQIRKIYNRFGELESFDRKKIVGSILGAIRIAGRSDEWIADKLAPMIELALANRFEEDSPTVDDIAYFVEQSLRAIEDLHDVAEAYVNNRSRSSTLRELEEETPNADTDGPQVTPLARGELLGWDRSRIEAALVREENLSISQARVVAAAVEGKVKRMALKSVTTGLIRELVDVELVERGLRAPTLAPSQLTLPAYDIGQAIFPVGDQTPETWIDSPRAMRRFAADAVLSQYTLASVHTPDIRSAHVTGAITLEHLDSPASFHDISLDCSKLASKGAGLELDTFFARDLNSATELLDRLMHIVSELADISSGSLELRHIDSAFAPYIRSAHDASEIAQSIVDRIALGTENTQVCLVLDAVSGSVDTPGSLQLARAFLDALGDGKGRSNMELVLRVGSASVGDPQAHTLLERAAYRALADGRTAFRFMHSARSSTRRSALLFGEEDEGQALSSTPTSVALNLVAPFLASDSKDSASLFAECEPALKHAVQALKERSSFIERFYLRRGEAQPRLGAELGRKLAQALAPSHVTLLGLCEVSQALARVSKKADSASLLRTAQMIVSYLSFKLKEIGATLDVAVELSGDANPESAQRALTIDRRIYQEAQQEHSISNAPYSGGFSLAPASATLGDWQTRLEAEAALHPLAANATLQLTHDAARMTPAALVQSIARLAASPSTPAHSLKISVPMQQCASCGNVAPPAATSCPSCGATQWSVPSGQRLLFGNQEPHPHNDPPNTTSSYTVM